MILPKTVYVDFAVNVHNVRTEIRVFETVTHLFVYVNQDTEEIMKYDGSLDRVLKRVRNKKTRVVYCNVRGKDYLNEIGNHLIKVLKKIDE